LEGPPTKIPVVAKVVPAKVVLVAVPLMKGEKVDGV
jgi:hypothetical protein